MTTRTTSALYRHHLPQLGSGLFLSDSGLETQLIFHDGMDLPLFASFTLLDTASGRERLRRYFASHVEIARRHGVGIVLETPTWRASADWGATLGFDGQALERINRTAIEDLVALRGQMGSPETPIVISGNIGPRGDGYAPGRAMSIAEAERYHGAQIATFADTAADLVSAFTMNYVEEAAGIALAARRVGMPLVLSFTVETDARLPTGQTLQDAIAAVESISGGYPAYYMINCAHPTHFDAMLSTLDAGIAARIRGVRANASRRSHAELDNATDLDDGNPVEMGAEFGALRRRLPHLCVVGGCCGTDQRHVEAIAGTLAGARAASSRPLRCESAA